MFTENQKEILSQAGITLRYLKESAVCAIAEGSDEVLDAASLMTDALIEFIAVAIALYRGGEPVIADDVYDFQFLSELERRDPNHPFLKQVEPEAGITGKTVDLPARMLSTDKAYSKDTVEKWVSRVRKACDQLGMGFSKIFFRVTGKLDGFAAYDDGERLYTRGNGTRGTDITRAFDRGLSVASDGARGQGPGEIVVLTSYFNDNLASHFENTRNVQASVIREYTPEEYVQKAIDDKAVVFYPFRILPAWEGSWAELEPDFEKVIESIRSSVSQFGCDGVVLEITDEKVKEYMGATRHHWRWQIALKKNSQSAQARIVKLVPQCGRTGRITPVAEIVPTRLGGVMNSRATASHYQMVIDKGIGPGALIELVRGGEVIPKLERVLEPATPEVPEQCPACSGDLVWDGVYLCCTNNMECPAQITNSLKHFFKMLGNVDGFGSATADVLYVNNIRTIDQVYALTEAEFESMGFGPKESENFVAELLRSRTERIEDWRLLAAFGVFRLGPGNCEKLLSSCRIEDVFDLDEEAICAVSGFAEKTAKVVVPKFRQMKALFEKIYGLGFNLSRTTLAGQNGGGQEKSPVADKLVVFTGTMRGSRSEMEKQAKLLGAKVGSSVTGKTDFLVRGENVGATKTADATKKGVKIISEAEYLALIGMPVAASDNAATVTVTIDSSFRYTPPVNQPLPVASPAAPPVALSIAAKVAHFMGEIETGVIYQKKNGVPTRELLKKPKVPVICFSDLAADAMFCGPVVDTYLRCSSGETGFIVPLEVRVEMIAALDTKYPGCYREFIFASEAPADSSAASLAAEETVSEMLNLF